MSEISRDQLLIASVLDRLIDDPENDNDGAQGRYQNLQALKTSVLRDLQNLLNTRWPQKQLPAGLTSLEPSILNYGLPDLSNENFADPSKQREFIKLMERVIKRYENRFERVKVRILSDSGTFDRTVRFRIDALLKADPSPEPVVFNSSLEPASGMFDVSDEQS